MSPDFSLCVSTVPRIITCGVLLALSACGPSKPYSTSANADDLIRVIAPRWSKGKQIALQLPADPKKDDAIEYVSIDEMLAVKLSTDHVVLFVSGAPSDEKGNSTASHATQGNLGAYWFQRRDEKWYRTTEQPSFAQTGFFGKTGEIKATALGGGKMGLSIENGSCWQGSCGAWLSLYEVELGKVAELLANEKISADSIGAHEVCGEMLKHSSGYQRVVESEKVGECYAVSGRWQIQKNSKAPGDLIFQFSGNKTVDKGEVDSKAYNDDEEDPPVKNLFLVRAFKQTMTMRYTNGRYVKTKGNNPVPDL